jgi:hypothetical protein
MPSSFRLILTVPLLFNIVYTFLARTSATIPSFSLYRLRNITSYITSYYNDERRYFDLPLNTYSLDNRIFLIPLIVGFALFRSAVVQPYAGPIIIISKYTLPPASAASSSTDARYVDTPLLYSPAESPFCILSRVKFDIALNIIASPAETACLTSFLFPRYNNNKIINFELIIYSTIKVKINLK